MKERFMSKVEPVTETGCWLWTAALGVGGYGAFAVGERMERAHRVSYKLFVGDVPSDKMVLHRCDVPSCVNPSHLFLGVAQDNTSDMLSKGREARGEKNGNSRLSEEDAKRIRLSSGSQRSLARKYGVAQSTISRLMAGSHWKHTGDTNE